jgi:hypothetical protein
MVEPDDGSEELRVRDDIPTQPAMMPHPSFVDQPEDELSELPTAEVRRDTEDFVAEKSLAGGTQENGGSSAETHLPDTEIEILQELYQRKCKECEGLKKTIAFLRQAVREADDLLYEKSWEIEQMELRIQSVTYLHEEKKEDKNQREKSKKKKNKKKETTARRPMRPKMPPMPEGERKRNNNNDPRMKRKTTKSKEEPTEEQKKRSNENRKYDKENDVRNQKSKPKPEAILRKPREDFEKSERTKRKEALLASLSARQTTNELSCEQSSTSGPNELSMQGYERREEAIIKTRVGDADAKKDATIESKSSGIFEVTSTHEQLLVEISTKDSDEQIITKIHVEHTDERMSTSEEAPIKVSGGDSDVMKSDKETIPDMRSVESELKVAGCIMTSYTVLALPDNDGETAGAHPSSAGEHSVQSPLEASGDDNPVFEAFEETREERSDHSDIMEGNFKRLDIVEQNYPGETSFDIKYRTLIDGDSSSTRDCIFETSNACTPQCVASIEPATIENASTEVDNADHVADGHTLSTEESGALVPQPPGLADESILPDHTDEHLLLLADERQKLCIDLDGLDCEAMESSSEGISSQSREDVPSEVKSASNSSSTNLSALEVPLPSAIHDPIQLPQANEPVVVRVEI